MYTLRQAYNRSLVYGVVPEFYRLRLLHSCFSRTWTKTTAILVENTYRTEPEAHCTRLRRHLPSCTPDSIVFEIKNYYIHLVISTTRALLTASQYRMPFCTYCSKIPSRIFSTRRDEQGYHDHHESLSDLTDSAAAGCRMCILLLSSLRSYKGTYAKTFQGDLKDRYRLMSTKFGVQNLLFGYSEVGCFRGAAMPKRWSV